jgi:phosphosulfolactate phosphohydrolase-like enzyme
VRVIFQTTNGLRAVDLFGAGRRLFGALIG